MKVVSGGISNSSETCIVLSLTGLFLSVAARKVSEKACHPHRLAPCFLRSLVTEGLVIDARKNIVSLSTLLNKVLRIIPCVDLPLSGLGSSITQPQGCMPCLKRWGYECFTQTTRVLSFRLSSFTWFQSVLSPPDTMITLSECALPFSNQLSISLIFFLILLTRF